MQLFLFSQFRKESRAAGADGESQKAAEDPEEAAGEGVWGCSPQELKTAAGKGLILHHPEEP